MARTAAVLLAVGVGAFGCSSGSSTDESTPDATTDTRDTAPADDTSVDDTGPADTFDAFADDTDAGADALDAVDTADGGIAGRCFKATISGGTGKAPDYDKFSPVVGSHCFGTNHQDITGVEQVVFFGDSVTVGTPNTAHPLSADNAHFYRNQLAEWLAGKFTLDRGSLIDWGLWKSYDYVSGIGGKMQSGAFLHCAKWGARTDDFLAGGNQIGKCFPTGSSDKKTLFVFTMGGNDISSLTKLGADATDAEVAANYPAARALAKDIVKYLDDAVAWMKDPTHFPKGSFVVMSNPYEFTDATGDVSSCPAAGLTGFKSWKKPEVQQEIVISILESYMDIAVKRKVDLIWALEHFCGHGYVSTKASTAPTGACWLGPGAPLWFDETCIHPNDAGHTQLFTMFKATIAE